MNEFQTMQLCSEPRLKWERGHTSTASGVRCDTNTLRLHNLKPIALFLDKLIFLFGRTPRPA